MIYYKKGVTNDNRFFKNNYRCSVKIINVSNNIWWRFSSFNIFFIGYKKRYSIVFAQAYEEKYMFKSPKLKESYEDWTRRMIKNGEIK